MHFLLSLESCYYEEGTRLLFLVFCVGRTKPRILHSFFPLLDFSNWVTILLHVHDKPRTHVVAQTVQTDRRLHHDRCP